MISKDVYTKNLIINKFSIPLSVTSADSGMEWSKKLMQLIGFSDHCIFLCNEIYAVFIT